MFSWKNKTRATSSCCFGGYDCFVLGMGVGKVRKGVGSLLCLPKKRLRLCTFWCGFGQEQKAFQTDGHELHKNHCVGRSWDRQGTPVKIQPCGNTNVNPSKGSGFRAHGNKNNSDPDARRTHSTPPPPPSAPFTGQVSGGRSTDQSPPPEPDQSQEAYNHSMHHYCQSSYSISVHNTHKQGQQ